MKNARLSTHFWLLAVCFFASGLSGLVYQTVWSQQLALVFGATETAVVMVLAAYMGGLALGAAIAGRWVHRIRRPILAYGLLELAIAVFALLVPFLVDTVGQLQAFFLGGVATPPPAASGLFYLFGATLILIIPTAMMGATLPLLARYTVRTDAQIGSRTGMLYAANTAGAAAGAWLTAYWLLPKLGLGGVVYLAAAINAAVFFFAYLLARKAQPNSVNARDGHTGNWHWILPLALLSGGVSFGWEVLWTRLLGPFLGGSLYAYATMLSSFLIALAAGAAIAAPLASSRQRAICGFAVAQCLIALFSAISYLLTNHLPDWEQMLSVTPGGAHVLTSPEMSVVVALMLLPGALMIGATFPFAVRAVADRATDAPRANAQVFAWNTTGAIAGAILTGFLILPALQFSGTVALMTALSLMIAAVCSWVAGGRWRIASGVVALAVAIPVIVPPPSPLQLLRHGALSKRVPPGDFVFFEVGRTATVMLRENRDQWFLTTNGLPESSMESPDYRPGRHVTARWLGLAPLAVRPATQSMLVVGLGAGVTVENLPPSIKNIHVVELEEQVLAANRQVGSKRRFDPLSDSRVTIEVNDARSALRLNETQYDAIVSQPSHPWTTGAANLFTQEFYQLIAKRLTADGVFVQWMGLHFVDAALLQSIIATAAASFPHINVLYPGQHQVLVVGSLSPLAIAETAKEALDLTGSAWTEIGATCSADLEATLLFDDHAARAFSHSSPVITDQRNLLRMKSATVIGRTSIRSALEVHVTPELATTAAESIRYVRRVGNLGRHQHAENVANGLATLAKRETALGLLALDQGKPREAARRLGLATRMSNAPAEATLGLMTLARQRIVAGIPASLALNPVQTTLSEGWRLHAAGDWRAVRNLEPQLSGLDHCDPHYDAALRLRVAWRIESEEAAATLEALEMQAPLLAPNPSPAVLLDRARAAAVLGNSKMALLSLAELNTLRPSAAILSQAQIVLRSLPIDSEWENWRQEMAGVGANQSPAD